jgi:hypothetical protein
VIMEVITRQVIYWLAIRWLFRGLSSKLDSQG